MSTNVSSIGRDTLLHTSLGTTSVEEYVQQKKVFGGLSVSGLDGPEVPKLSYIENCYSYEVVTEDGYYVEGNPACRVMSVSNNKLATALSSIPTLTTDHYIGLKVGSNIWQKTAPKVQIDLFDVRKKVQLSRYSARLIGAFAGYFLSGKSEFEESLYKEYGKDIRALGRVTGATTDRVTFEFLKCLGLSEVGDFPLPSIIRKAPVDLFEEFLYGFMVSTMYKYFDNSTQPHRAKFMEQLQVMLLNYGIVSQLKNVNGFLKLSSSIDLSNVSCAETFHTQLVKAREATVFKVQSRKDLVIRETVDPKNRKRELKIKDIDSYTDAHNVIWSKVAEVRRNTGYIATYGGHMPSSGSIIANGVIVSHHGI